jgi:hypothetical protein
MKRRSSCLVLCCLLAGCAASGYSTVADRKLQQDILKTIVAHGSGTNRKFNYLGVSKKPLQGPSGSVSELWSIREQWTDRFAHYQVTMTPDGTGETDFAIQEVDASTGSS